MSDTPKEGDLHTEAGLFLVMHEALAAEREWRARLEIDLADAQQRIRKWRDLCEEVDRENAELSDQVMRWFKAASPYATPGSLEEGMKNSELGRRKGWNSAIRRAAEVAEHYAKLMNSEAVQRVADEIRAMKSEP